MKRKGLFITGTDTDVGKTYISTQIIRQLSSKVAMIKTRKPIESGCTPLDDGSLFPADGALLQKANENQEPLDIITPFRFEPAIAPDRAAQLAGTPISTQQLKQACLHKTTEQDFLIVEGAGGFYSPLSNDGLNVDLAKALNLDVILVVKDKLGCINHTLLTLSAIKKEQLNCMFIVLNNYSDHSAQKYQHAFEIHKHTGIRVFSCPTNGNLQNLDITL